MVELRNPARERLETGEVSIGIGIRLARSADIASMMKTAGMDWLFVDLEHGALTLDQTAQISCAALASGIAPLVRVPRGEMAMATRALDGGALGIIMPQCETADEAREIVERLHYAPEGSRGVVGGLPQFGFANPDMTSAMAAMNPRSDRPRRRNRRGRGDRYRTDRDQRSVGSIRHTGPGRP